MTNKEIRLLWLFFRINLCAIIAAIGSKYEMDFGLIAISSPLWAHSVAIFVSRKVIRHEAR